MRVYYWGGGIDRGGEGPVLVLTVLYGMGIPGAVAGAPGAGCIGYGIEVYIPGMGPVRGAPGAGTLVAAFCWATGTLVLLASGIPSGHMLTMVFPLNTRNPNERRCSPPFVERNSSTSASTKLRCLS